MGDDQYKGDEMMYTKAIEDRIARFKCGHLFCICDFLDIAKDDSIRKTLERLEKCGVIIRIMRGIYLLPNLDESQKIVKPSPYEVAIEIARYHGWLCAPSGKMVTNYFKLTHEVIDSITLVSDGPNKQYQYETTRISFKHSHSKDLVGLSMITISTIQAIKAMKISYFNQAGIMKLAEQLSEESKQILRNEVDQITLWVAKIIKEVCKY